jgi:hypothetical protein
MSQRLWKCVDPTPNGVLRPMSLQDYRVYRATPYWRRMLEHTTHIRFWADWPSLQPSPHYAFGDPRNPDHSKLLGLDEQIRLANVDGLHVILMPYRYPRWVNGTDHIPGQFTDENFFFRPADRCRMTVWLPWHADQANPELRTTLGRAMRAPEYAFPPDGHGVDSAWGHFVAALMDRYVDHAPRHGRVRTFEVVNEPNLQVFPQRSPSAWPDDPVRQFEVEGSRLLIHETVAEMMATMDHLARRARRPVACIGPSHSDSDVATAPRLTTIHTSTPYSTAFEPFVENLLDALGRTDFRGGSRWTWSYHNYNDMEWGEARTPILRERLRGRWNGRVRDGGAALWATEGGVRLDIMGRRFGVTDPAARRALQAQVLETALYRHRSRRDVGAGVELLTQYTLIADPNYDCGLREPTDGVRPAFETWCGFAIRDRLAAGGADAEAKAA